MQPLLPIHILAGVLGLVSGAAALSAAKGATLHRKSGLLFVYAMVAMAGSGVTMRVRIRGNVRGVIGLSAQETTP